MSSCFAAYKAWVQEHGAQLRLIEHVASGCTWLLPNRFSKTEVGIQAFSSLVGLLRLWHNSLLKEDASPTAFTNSMALDAISQVELLYEMQAEHFADLGKCNKTTSLAALELLKLFVRLYMLYSSKTYVTPVATCEAKLQQRDPYAIVKAFQRRTQESGTSDLQGAWHSVSEKWHSAVSLMSPSCSSLLSLPIHEDSDWDNNREDDSAHELLESDGSSLWWQNCPTTGEGLQEDAPPVTQEDETAEFSYKAGRLMMLIGEVLYLLRPIICIFCLRKYGPRSWRSWGLSLGMDVASRTLISKGAQLMKSAGVKQGDLTCQDKLLNYFTMLHNFPWTPIEDREMKRRKTMFLMYLMRSPVFDSFTKPGLESVQRVMSSIPVMGQVTGKALELLYGVQRYHVYTSGVCLYVQLTLKVHSLRRHPQNNKAAVL